MSLSQPIPSSFTSPSTSSICQSPSLSHSFSHRLKPQTLFIFSTSLPSHTNPFSVSCDPQPVTSCSLFFQYSLHLLALLETYLGPEQTSGPGVEVVMFLATFKLSPFPSCKNHCPLNANIIGLHHSFYTFLHSSANLLVTLPHSLVFCSPKRVFYSTRFPFFIFGDFNKWMTHQKAPASQFPDFHIPLTFSFFPFSHLFYGHTPDFYMSLKI